MKLSENVLGIIFAGLFNTFCTVNSNVVIEIVPKFSSELIVLKSLANDQVLLSDKPLVNKTLHVSMGTSKWRNTIHNLLTENNIQFRLFQEHELKKFLRIKRSEDDEKYLTWDEFENWIRMLKSTRNSLVKISVLGKSFESRNIYSIKLGENIQAPNVLLDSGSHAREWLSIASLVGTIKIILNDLNQPGEDGLWKGILRKWNIYFVPVLNPDGYFHSMKSLENRFWRKNRQLNVDSNCTGVDINRNYPIGFTENNDPCQEDFPGGAPFTTLESQSLRKIVSSIQSNLKLYVSLHCYGQFILLPWAYKNEKVSDHTNLVKLANDIQKTMFRVGNKNFKVGTPGELLYTAGGTSFDWVKSLGVPYSYTIELFPSEDKTLGFIVSENFIKNSTDEVYESLLTFLSKI